jgi:hypothetical protein
LRHPVKLFRVNSDLQKVQHTVSEGVEGKVRRDQQLLRVGPDVAQCMHYKGRQKQNSVEIFGFDVRVWASDLKSPNWGIQKDERLRRPVTRVVGCKREERAVRITA